MKILLFEPDASGHRETYVRRIAGALAPAADVSVAVPDELAERLVDVPAQLVPLGPARETGTFAATDRAAGRRARSELAAFERAVAATGPDHAFHLSADALLRELVRGAPRGAAVSLLIFRARSHYGRLGSRLSAKERAVSVGFERLLALWRRRRDAHAVFTLDPYAADRWARGRGASAVWLPEPPVLVSPASGDRDGLVLLGSLAPRKGLHLLAQDGALPRGVRLVLAGGASPGYGDELQALIGRLGTAGVGVEATGPVRGEQAVLDVLARARCALLPYPRHFGMSRVLLEAAVAGTPVVAHEFGLVGHLVREHDLGAAVDCTDPRAIAAGLESVLGAPERYEPRLAAFAERFSPPAFEAALGKVFA